MNEYNKMLMQYLKDIKKYEGNETDITIVGGIAMDIHFPEASIKTYDIDVLTNNPSIYQYGVSIDANNIERSYGNYKSDRKPLENLSNEKIKTFVLGKERLIASKAIANRKKDIKHIEAAKEHYNNFIDWKKVENIKREIKISIKEEEIKEEIER